MIESLNDCVNKLGHYGLFFITSCNSCLHSNKNPFIENE